MFPVFHQLNDTTLLATAKFHGQGLSSLKDQFCTFLWNVVSCVTAPPVVFQQISLDGTRCPR